MRGMRQARSMRLIVVATRGRPLLFSVMERLCKHVKNKLHTKARHAKQAGKVDGKIVLENQCGICKAVKGGSL